jgi:alkanesulfonate monooxygenase SsuD/methylene tetrahydromethanopterin reductase-like flavin-dependent oxidoreductase (luciferase family)
MSVCDSRMMRWNMLVPLPSKVDLLAPSAVIAAVANATARLRLASSA